MDKTVQFVGGGSESEEFMAASAKVLQGSFANPATFNSETFNSQTSNTKGKSALFGKMFNPLVFNPQTFNMSSFNKKTGQSDVWWRNFPGSKVFVSIQAAIDSLSQSGPAFNGETFNSETFNMSG